MEIKYSSGKLRGKIREVCGTEKEFAKVLKISATALSLKLNNKSGSLSTRITSVNHYII
jgi:hypothetical protein